MAQFFNINLSQMKVLLWIAIILTGCALAQDNTAESDAAIPEQEIRFINGVGDFPSACGPRDIVGVVNRFIDAYNTGDVDALEHVFVAQFRWFTDGVAAGTRVDPATYFETSTRDELAAYITSRHAQNERLRLLQISVAGPSWHGGMDITFTLAREADDLPTTSDIPVRIAQGKGAVSCPEKQIFVWSMATGQLGDIPEIMVQDASYQVDFDHLPHEIVVFARNAGNK